MTKLLTTYSSLLRTAAEKGSVEAMNTLAWRLATANDDAPRDGRNAVDLAQRVLAKAGGNSWSHLDTLAAAQAEVGEFAKAADSQRQAIGACQDEEIKTHLTERLKLYESGTPFREPW